MYLTFFLPKFLLISLVVSDMMSFFTLSFSAFSLFFSEFNKLFRRNRFNFSRMVGMAYRIKKIHESTTKSAKYLQTLDPYSSFYRRKYWPGEI